MSLIETLIGLTIGLLVVLAAIGTIVFTKTTSVTLSDAARLHQDAATAMRIIGGEIRRTGARRVIDSADPPKVRFTQITFTPINGTDRTLTDTLSISYEAEPGLEIKDCLGQDPTSADPNMINSTFDVSDGMLRCQNQALIEGVEEFQVWYGTRGANGGLQYIPAGSMGSTDWAQVDAVRVCLRLAGSTQSNTTTGTLGCTGQAVASDGRIRRTFTQVFHLRNSGL